MNKHIPKTDGLLHQQANRIAELEKRCKQAEDALNAIVKRNEVLGSSIPLGIFTVDKEGRITGSNSKMNKLLLWPSVDTLKSMSIFENSALLDNKVVVKLRHCFELMKPVVTEYSHVNREGELIYLRFHLAPVFESEDLVSELIVLVEDITDLKKAESATKESENKCRLLFQSAPVGMIECDAAELKAYTDSLRVSGVRDLEGYFAQNPEEVFHCMDLIKTENYNKAYLELLEAENIEEAHASLAKGTPAEYLKLAKDIVMMVSESTVYEEKEETLTTARGNTRSVLSKSYIISGHEHPLSSVIMTLTDITKLKEAQEALRASEQRYRQQSLRDNLTGLYNRRYLYSSLSRLIETSKTDDMSLSVLFIDLDDFKRVVDTYGHLNGSLAIQEVATTIRECLKDPSYAVSYAGDEFVVVMPGVDYAQADEKASEIQLRISNKGFLNGQGIQAKLTASFGIATYPENASDSEGLLASSDKALFEAKRSGKNKIRKAEELRS